MMHFITAFDTSAGKSPDKPCLRVNGASLSYAQMQQRSYQAARALQSLGVKPGDRVAAMCFNTPGFVDVLLGAWRLNATFVPVNHKLQGPEVAYILEHSKAKVLVIDGALGGTLKNLQTSAKCLSTDSAASGWEDFDALRAAQSDAPLELALGDEHTLAEILYTSGTTGRPKGCMLEHRSVVFTAMTAALGLSITRDERTLIAMPIWHASPLNNWLLATLYVGGTTVLLREYHPLHFLQTVQDERKRSANDTLAAAIAVC